MSYKNRAVAEQSCKQLNTIYFMSTSSYQSLGQACIFHSPDNGSRYHVVLENRNKKKKKVKKQIRKSRQIKACSDTVCASQNTQLTVPLMELIVRAYTLLNSSQELLQLCNLAGLRHRASIKSASAYH